MILENGFTSRIAECWRRSLNWESVDWKILEALRAPFLSQSPLTDYWRSPTLLDHYDLTFAQRIGWKWDSVLTELKGLGFSPQNRPWLVDWGCGTGIASRRMLASYGDVFGGVHFWDRSKMAMDYAAKTFTAQFPTVPVGAPPEGQPRWLLLSHVIGELQPSELASIFSWISQANVVIWIEPGTPLLSRQLINVREELRGQFHVVAPCTHQAACGMLTPGNERHWCHHFAKPPTEVFQSRHWKLFGDKMGIDLRSLPTSFLVLSKEPRPSRASEERVIGRARHFKGYSTYLGCDETGVAEKKSLKRNEKEWIKFLKDDPFTARKDRSPTPRTSD